MMNEKDIIAEQVYHKPDIYKIEVPLRGNALKNLNSYVILDGGESLVIDTGFLTEECRQVLIAGLGRLGVSPEHTKLFITHLHSDHMGLAQYFDYPDSTIYMGEIEYDYYLKLQSGRINKILADTFLVEGFPDSELEEATFKNPARVYLPSESFSVTTVADQQKIRVGGVELTALLMPGHTAGQMCLYIEKEKIMFTADHVLFDITPNITNWPGMTDPLDQYIHSLNKIRSYAVETVFPAHRNLSDKSMEQRIEEIIAHHRARAEEILTAIREHPGSHAYEIASVITWSLHGRTFATAPKQQKWFAVGETLAHIDYLLHRGRIRREYSGAEGEFARYYIV